MSSRRIYFLLLSIVVIAVVATYIFVINIQIQRRNNLTIAIYDDSGVWSYGVLSLEKYLESRNISYLPVTSNDILANKLGNFDIFIMPGGWAYNYYMKLGEKGNSLIREYVKRGGNFIGICAGAFYASQDIIWENNKYKYGLGLLNVDAIGPKKGYPWPTSSYLTIILNEEAVKAGLNSSYEALYYGGPEFSLKKSDIEIIAKYQDDGMPAIIYGKYGEGKVVLIGVHLEIDERNWVILDYIFNLIYPKYVDNGYMLKVAKEMTYKDALNDLIGGFIKNILEHHY